ncbi:probable phosphotriesterase [Leucobacter sp. 7(1)]|uniref:phosphotriesterase family protein n=1 Tax=Leucobacter sp. 7(1) TaxID=1255613 RepID=UPI00097E9315|nr:phosphotriesterase [Leucobacter sp. 7(1)]SJN11806.1 probable phosphotriesterase [Leucobacter sp. 7(1)]
MTASRTVTTMRGPIDAEGLGFTLMHEHLFVRSLETAQNYSTTWDSDDVRVADAVRQLEAVRADGVSAIVDLTVLGIGRDIRLMDRVAQEVGLHIIAATGAYVLDRLPYHFRFHPPTRNGDLAAGLAEWFVRDIEEGIAGTRIRAGVIKCATDTAGMTEDVVASVRAAAITANHTGALIMTHADAALRNGHDQQRIFVQEGVDLSRVVIGHVGDSTDLNYHRSLMDSGMTIGLDRFGLGLSTSERVAAIVTLCREGYSDRMVLSHDAACHSEWIDTATPGLENWNFQYVPRVVVPLLHEKGVAESDVQNLVVNNPQRLLGMARTSEERER